MSGFDHGFDVAGAETALESSQLALHALDDDLDEVAARLAGSTTMNRSTSQRALATAVPTIDRALAISTSARDLFAKFDENGSGEIDKAHFLQLKDELLAATDTETGLTPSQLAAMCFADADADHNDTISFGEFVAMYNSALHFSNELGRVCTEGDRIESSAQAAREFSAQSGGTVLGGRAFSTAYRLSRSVANHEHIDISNNHVGAGILEWIARFDPLQKMTLLRACNSHLRDGDVAKLARSLCDHAHIRRIDLRGNKKLADRGIKALLELAVKNRGVVEVLIDEEALMVGPQTDNYQRLRKALIVNRRAQNRGGRLAHRRGDSNSSLPPIRSSLYNGDRPDDRVVNSQQITAAPCLMGLIRAKKTAAGKWRQQVHAGKTKRARARQETERTVKAKHIVTVSAGDAAAPVDIRRAGNLDMYSDVAQHQRKSLRYHPEIVACLYRWWTCVIIPIVDTDHSGTLGREEYIVFHKCLNRALLSGEPRGENNCKPPELSSAEATQMALEDWEHDCGAAATIDAERFRNALFEMCDLWTDTTDPQEYVDFLEWLFEAMSEAMRRFPKLTEHQRQNMHFQKRQQRLLADAKRAKVARLAACRAGDMFDGEMMARLHRDFERFAEGKQQVSRSVFNKIMAMQGYPASVFTSRLFDVFDTDLSHTIDYRELVMGLSLLCTSSKETLARLVFRMFDLAGTGMLSKQSLLTILSVSSRLHGNSGRGYSDKDEKRRKKSGLGTIEAIVDQIFSESGQDGAISIEVFQDAVKAHPELLPSMVDLDAARHMGLVSSPKKAGE
jgi:Ca2+-binding EF-hand superfamily protein